MRQDHPHHNADTVAPSRNSRGQRLRHEPGAGKDHDRGQNEVLAFRDGAELIGIALRQARLGEFRPGAVPNAIMMQLGWCAARGDAAAMLTVDYLHRRALATITAPDGSIRLEDPPSLTTRVMATVPPGKTVARPRPMQPASGSAAPSSSNRTSTVRLVSSTDESGGER